MRYSSLSAFYIKDFIAEKWPFETNYDHTVGLQLCSAVRPYILG